MAEDPAPVMAPAAQAAVVETPAPAPAAAPAAVVAAPTPVAPPRPPVAAEPIRMRKPAAELEAERRSMLDAAGLALVETDPQKWREAYDRASSIVEAPVAKRVLKPRPPLEQGPLVQVETRR